MVGLNGLRGFLRPKQFNDSMILRWGFHLWLCGIWSHGGAQPTRAGSRVPGQGRFSPCPGPQDYLLLQQCRWQCGPTASFPPPQSRDQQVTAQTQNKALPALRFSACKIIWCFMDGKHHSSPALRKWIYKPSLQQGHKYQTQIPTKEEKAELGKDEWSYAMSRGWTNSNFHEFSSSYPTNCLQILFSQIIYSTFPLM